MNTYDKYMTGCSSGVPSAALVSSCGSTYDIMIDQGGGKGYAGAGASTTGNITGIYDISGGSWEYTMGVLDKRAGYTETINSGYAGKITNGSSIGGREWPAAKYYDLYTSDDPLTACDGSPCKGHALNEISGWYDDYATMVSMISPWADRGGYHGSNTLAGVFVYNNAHGGVYAHVSFRQVLTPM